MSSSKCNNSFFCSGPSSCSSFKTFRQVFVLRRKREKVKIIGLLLLFVLHVGAADRPQPRLSERGELCKLQKNQCCAEYHAVCEEVLNC